MLKVLIGQIGVGLILAAVLWGTHGRVAGYSALLGSLTCVVPNAFLALRLMVPRRDAGAQALLRAAWVGEIGKLGLTVLMFSADLDTKTPMQQARRLLPYLSNARHVILVNGGHDDLLEVVADVLQRDLRGANHRAAEQECRQPDHSAPFESSPSSAPRNEHRYASMSSMSSPRRPPYAGIALPPGFSTDSTSSFMKERRRSERSIKWTL